MKQFSHSAHRKHIRKIHLHLYTVYVFTILLLIFQIIALYLITAKITKLEHVIGEEYFSLQKRIDGNFLDSANKIREISNSLRLLEVEQLDLEEQLGVVKASTSSDFSGVAESSIKSVVTVATDITQGSGFFVRDDGYIVTNAHVLFGATFAEVITYDKLSYPAQLIGYDTENDIALLHVDRGSFGALQLENSEDVRIGEKVIAIGNPLGLSFTTTEGIVSAVDRQGPNGLSAYIQTDVSLNPGNSGGPLINKEGRVIGINNFKLSNAESIGFALESNYIRDTLNRIAKEKLEKLLLE